MSNENYFSLIEIGFVAGVTKKTVKKTMDILKEDLVVWKEQVDLIYNESQGYRLDINQDFSLNEIKLMYLKNSLVYNILKEILDEKFIDITTFSIENFMSYTAVHNKFSDIKTILKGFDLELASNPSTKLIGEEKQIRYFSYLFFLHSNYSVDWPFQQVAKEDMNEVIKELEKKRDLDLSEKESLRFWLATSVIRIQKGYHISAKATTRPVFIDEDSVGLFEKKLADFFLKYVDLLPTELQNEIYFIYEVFFSFDYHDQNDVTVNSIFIKMPRYQALDYVEITSFWLDTYLGYFKQELNISNYSILYANLLHIHYRMTFLKSGYPALLSLANEEVVSMKMSSFIGDMEDFYQELEKNTKFGYFFENQNKEILFPEYCLILRNLNETLHKKTLNIFMYSVSGKKNSNYLKDKVNRYYRGPIHFVKKLTKEVDLIITDCFFEEMTWYSCEKFIWNVYPTARDLSKLELVLENL